MYGHDRDSVVPDIPTGEDMRDDHVGVRGEGKPHAFHSDHRGIVPILESVVSKGGDDDSSAVIAVTPKRRSASNARYGSRRTNPL